SHRAPEADGDRVLQPHIFDFNIRDLIFHVFYPLHSRWVNLSLHPGRHDTGKNRRADDFVVPGSNRATVIKRATDLAGIHRAIEVVLHVLLPGPDQFHWLTGCLRELKGLNGDIDLEAPSKPPAEICGVDTDLVWPQSGNLGCCLLHSCLVLRGDPNIAAILPDVSSAVHWFHSHMREIWQEVCRFDRLGSFFNSRRYVSVLSCLHSLFCQIGENLAFKHLGIEFGVCSAVPFCLKGFPPAPRRIDGISTYRNATVDTHYLPHALYFPWRLFVV